MACAAYRHILARFATVDVDFLVYGVNEVLHVHLSAVLIQHQRDRIVKACVLAQLLEQELSR